MYMPKQLKARRPMNFTIAVNDKKHVYIQLVNIHIYIYIGQ